jgi:predicted Zn-dependent protease
VRILFRLKAAVLAVGVLLLAAAPAHAEWRRAESANFIIYSQGSESSLRRQARTLELYDYILRARMGLPLDEPPARKLPIYLVGGRSGLREIRPDLPAHVAGFYGPTTEGIFATAIRDQDMDFLLHEYFHHFSFQHGSAGNLPGWLVEGMAEYFMTAEVRDNVIRIGEYNLNRAEWLLSASWIPMEDLLGKRQDQLRPGSSRDTYYPVAWLLTHWFMSDETRRAQLGAYIRAVHDGGDPVRAMEETTGLTLNQLRSRLQSYMRGSLQITVYEVTRPEPEITVTRLPRSADDLLLLGQRLKVGVAENQRAATAALVRQRAARHPDDPFALLQLGHAELHFGDPLAGEAVLTRLLEREPENVEALQLMASRYMRLARDEGEDRTRRLVQAQSYLRRAYAADPEQYYTLYMLAQVREAARDYPTENDLLTWQLAYERAPQLPGIRLGFAAAMMHAEKFDEAVALLGPLANAPHGGGAADTARTLLERAEARQPPLSWDEIDAAQDAAARPPAPEPTEPSAAPPEDEDAAGEDEA